MLVPDKDAASSAMKKSRDPELEKKKKSHHPDNHRSCQANATASSVFSVGPCNPSGQQHDNSGQLLPPVTTLLPHSTGSGVVANRNNMPPYPMSDSERPLSIAVTTNRNNRNPVPGVPGGVTVTAVTTIPTTLPQVWPLTQCFMFAFV